MRIEILGVDCPVLPGVTVGVQRGKAVVDEWRADGSDQRWLLEAEVFDGADGARDLRGPFVHGRRGERFLYLVWSRSVEGMFRRAKLMLDEVPPELLDPAGGLRGTARLTMADGSPLCAAVRPPAISWSAI